MAPVPADEPDRKANLSSCKILACSNHDCVSRDQTREQLGTDGEAEAAATTTNTPTNRCNDGDSANGIPMETAVSIQGLLPGAIRE